MSFDESLYEEEMEELQRTYLYEAAEGEEVGGCFLLMKFSAYLTRDGRPIAKGVLQDASGAMPFVCFDYHGAVTERDVGGIVLAWGRINVRNGWPWLNAAGLARMSEKDHSQISLETLYRTENHYGDYAKAIVKLIYENGIRDKDYSKLCRALISENADTFFTCPASSRSHHSGMGGLVTHSIGVATAVFTAINEYSGLYGYQIDRDLALTGALLHDIGKVKQYCCDAQGVAMRRVAGVDPLQHAAAGAKMVLNMGRVLHTPEEKLRKVANIVGAHHASGAFSTGEKPQTMEANLVSMMDRLDSFLNVAFGKNIVFFRNQPCELDIVWAA